MPDGPAVPRLKVKEAKDESSQCLRLDENAPSSYRCERLDDSGLRFYSDRAFAPCTQLSLQICQRHASGKSDLRRLDAVVVGCELFSDKTFQIIVLFLEIEPPCDSLN